MSNLTVNLRGMSGTVEIEVPEGSSVADAREAANLSDSLGIAQNGERISREDEASTPVAASVTTLPPEVKAGC